MLVGVKHTPGLSLPKPVSNVEYEENHPVYSPGELAYPAGQMPPGYGPGAGGAGGAYCPPGQ